MIGMKTIEERAKEYADKESVNIFSNGTDEVYKKVLYEDYIKIANEQKKVDDAEWAERAERLVKCEARKNNQIKRVFIDNACDKVFTVLMNKTHFLGDDCKTIADELRKALEEE